MYLEDSLTPCPFTKIMIVGSSLKLSTSLATVFDEVYMTSYQFLLWKSLKVDGYPLNSHPTLHQRAGLFRLFL